MIRTEIIKINECSIHSYFYVVIYMMKQTIATI